MISKGVNNRDLFQYINSVSDTQCEANNRILFLTTGKITCGQNNIVSQSLSNYQYSITSHYIKILSACVIQKSS